MNKQELHEAFSTIHASEDLVKEVLTMKNKERKPVPIGRILWKAAAVAAVLALIVSVLGLWPAKVDPETGEIIAVPGVMKVYACELEETDEPEKFELTEGIGGYGSWIPLGNHIYGIPLSFVFPAEYFEGHEIRFDITFDYGYLFQDGKIIDDSALIDNNTEAYWRCSPLLNSDEIVDENGKFYGYIIIYADEYIVGYGVIDFVLLEEGNPMQVFSAVGFSTVCYPMVDGQFQLITEEYVWEQIEKCKQ